jgi:hypothetical protein
MFGLLEIPAPFLFLFSLPLSLLTLVPRLPILILPVLILRKQSKQRKTLLLRLSHNAG